MTMTLTDRPRFLPEGARGFLIARFREIVGVLATGAALFLALALFSYSPGDPSWNSSGNGTGVANWLGASGAMVADATIQLIGYAGWVAAGLFALWGARLTIGRSLAPLWIRALLLPLGVLAAAGLAAFLPANEAWLAVSAGGALGGLVQHGIIDLLSLAVPQQARAGAPWVLAGLSLFFLVPATGLGLSEWRRLGGVSGRGGWWTVRLLGRTAGMIATGLWRRIFHRREKDRIEDPIEDADRPMGEDDPGAERRAMLQGWLADLKSHATNAAARAGSVAQKRTVEQSPLRRMQPTLGRELERGSLDRQERQGLTPDHAEPGPQGQMADEDQALDNPWDELPWIAEEDGFEDPYDDTADLDIDRAVAARVAVAEPLIVSNPAPPAPAGAAKLDKVGERADTLPASKVKDDRRQAQLAFDDAAYVLPPMDILHLPEDADRPAQVSKDALAANAQLLEGVLKDFGIRGEIVKVNPGPVVTLYELEPAPGTKSSRVIGLADDIARSMSAISVRVAVVPGRNVIGIELPNQTRETVFFREIAQTENFDRAKEKLALILGKDIGGKPMLADLARMPHLLVAGTTGSGKSVAVNTMILSLLYRLPPEKVRFIMVDPKMLELSIYDGIPHLLAPVVTDPKKAVVALKWTVREMEDRYRAMSKMGVRNIEGYNQRLREAKAKGETLTRRVQTGFDPDTGKPVFEEQPIDLTELPYIVVVVDEMADLMLVAGKEIEATIQRLAQMARAAGIHLIMATQRPSVDVITGTIKANFPTRISFQVTSKIDSRTILGEGGAEQLLGQGDMLYMAGGGRITRVHGPFVSDGEVESVVRHLRLQGEPDYNESVLEDPDDGRMDGEMADGGSGSGDSSGDQLYDRAVALVAREKKASTSFIQRHLQIGYNRAARLIEQMEKEGVVSSANHVGRREVLIADHSG